jgi:hypothetical protein
MHLTPILILLATASASAILPRKCYGGDSWRWHQNKQLALDTVDKICNNASTSGTVSGTFKGEQQKKWCELGKPCTDCAGSYANSITFAVKWTKKDAPAGPLNDGDCNLRLKNEINGCGEAGGSGTTDGWFFM